MDIALQVLVWESVIDVQKMFIRKIVSLQRIWALIFVALPELD